MAENLRQSLDPITIWEPQPRQAAFITCPADDTGFGGARGGGKSDGVIGDFLDHEDTYGRDAIGLAFRRERTQLVELIERARYVLPPLGFKWHEQDKLFRGPKGGRLRFAYLESDADADAYQGHSYTRLYPEEMGTFPSEVPINKMQATLRSGNGVPCKMKGTLNPGGSGHQWCKARYRLDIRPQGMEVFEFEFTNPFTKKKLVKRRVFIPSKVTDNKYLGDDYVANLFMSGSDALVRAWLEGDWDAIEGAFFDGWRSDRHVIRPFEIPEHWARFRSFDWGYGAPFSVGWWAIASEQISCDAPAAARIIIPRGCMIRYREWYGSSSPNVGIRLEAEDIARGIWAREEGEKIAYGVADTAVFDQAGRAYGYLGPTIGERMNKTLGAVGATPFRGADKSRPQGWDQMRARLHGDLDGNPMLVVFNTCGDFMRTVPALQHDPIKPEDLDTDGEDHIADETRYGCMSRPWARPTPQEDKPLIDTRTPTLAAVVKATQRRRQNQDGRI